MLIHIHLLFLLTFLGGPQFTFFRMPKLEKISHINLFFFLKVMPNTITPYRMGWRKHSLQYLCLLIKCACVCLFKYIYKILFYFYFLGFHFWLFNILGIAILIWAFYFYFYCRQKEAALTILVMFHKCQKLEVDHLLLKVIVD